MSLKKIGNKRIEDFPPTTIYLNDLIEMVSILSETCKEVEIRSGEYVTTDAAELTELAKKFPNGRFDDVYLQSYNPYICIDIRSFGISVYISDDTAEQRGVIAQIADVINRGKKINPTWLDIILTLTSGALGVWQFILKNYVIGIILFVLPIVAIPFFVKHEMKNKVIIYTENRGTVKPFLIRKKDDILLAILAAILGGIVTYVFTKFLM